jgi:2-C-methyl-D-erythritol 4-phosphate cytidylyltransferase
MTDEKCDLILVAGGASSRFGAEIPKQFDLVNGRPLYLWSLDVFLSWKQTGRIIIVVPAEWVEPVGKSLAILPDVKRIKVVRGGESRQVSASNGLAGLTDSPGDWVMIHDAARPAITVNLLDRIWKARLTQPDLSGVVPGVKAKETVKMVRANGAGLIVDQTLPREKLYVIQTPQLLLRNPLAKSYAEAQDHQAPDDASLIERQGLKVLVEEGDYDNVKVTFMEDKERVSRWLRDRYPQI